MTWGAEANQLENGRVTLQNIFTAIIGSLLSVLSWRMGWTAAALPGKFRDDGIGISRC